MRKLMWFAIGFALACTLGAYFWVGKWMLVLVLPGIAGLGCFLSSEKRMKRIALVCLGAVLGTGWFYIYDQMYTAPLRQLDGQTVEVLLTTTDYSWEADYGSVVDCYLQLDDKRYKLRLYLKDYQELEPWMTIQTSAEIRLTTDGGENEPTFHRTQGILALGYQRDEGEIAVCADREAGFWVILCAKLRSSIVDTIDNCFQDDYAAFAKALFLGDKTDISYEMSTDFKVSGISHIVAVSGLHMSILFGLIAFVTWKRRYLLAILGIPSIMLFMLLACFTPSVTRAGIMMILMILSLVFKREYDPPTALSFAVVSLLAVNPLVAASVGFQLSLGSVAGIFLFMGKIYAWMKAWVPVSEHKAVKFLHGWLLSSLSATVSAQVITIPLVAYYFHTVSLVSVLTNLLVLWVISFVFYGIVLVCLVGTVWLSAGKMLAWITSGPIAFVLTVAKVMSKLPLAAVYTESVYIVLWLGFVYSLILFLIFGKEKRPFLSMGLASAGLAAALLLSWAEPRIHDQSVTVLDVGQGQSVILQHGDKTFLVDCGGDYTDSAADCAAQMLLSMGITRLDGLIITHYDTDHTGAVQNLLYRVDADKLYLPAGNGGEEFAGIADLKTVWVEEDIFLYAKGMKLTLFAAENAQTDNEGSIAVLFQTEKCDTLLTGDMSALRERILIREKEIPDLEILIAGHHGSKYSTSQELLDWTAPDVVIISAGKNNRYGHPAQETLTRLEQAGCTIYQTCESGTIVIRR